MKKIFIPLILASVGSIGLCACDDITKEDVEKFIIDNAEKWDDQFFDGFLVNFTMTVSMKDDKSDVKNTMKVDENGVFISYGYGGSSDPFADSAYLIKEGEVFKSYEYDNSKKTYVKRAKDFDKSDYDSAVAEGSLYVSFKSFYDKFTYDETEKAYKCAESLKCELDESIYRGSYIMSYNNVVKFEEGKLVSMTADYDFYSHYEGEYVNQNFSDGVRIATTSFDIVDINRTVVTAPANFILEAE